MTPESAKKELAKLISDYEQHREQYHQKGYDEIKFRNNIVNRFFKILGWDVDNTENLPEYNRDVIIHYKLKGRNSTTKPDYAFGLHAFFKPVFFVEAKTPATVIKDHKDSAHQIRRYGKSAELAVSILINFEEFAVYDCTKLPKQSEAASFGRMEFFTYTQYLDNFDFFWNAISKEAVKKGNFQKHFKTDLLKKGSVPLDKGFVEKLNEWREDLATSIGLNNKRLSEEDINYAVQLIIDRMIFLRFCEDRNIEHLGTLLDAARKGITHNNLLEIYYNADKKYNSGLFDFHKDAITPKIKIDNKILKNIIEELYRPKTEYEFGVMPVEILGNAYEQFLGNIIKIYPSGKAKIVEKPEVKKAGGVFYTPQYIVEYIVDHTVGELIKGKTPAQISKIKIVDPACGSGSFLLGAFVCLLKYHSDYYWKKGLHKKKSENSPLTQDGKLTVAEKKRILINNLFGVDIDPSAVEVTKLSLLLKALEGETEESIYQQVKLFHERALPDLDDNIKCGNSLIGYDFNGGFLELDKEERKSIEKKLKFFDWETSFPEIFRQGGFDVVIGNPPYVRIQEMADTQPENLPYYKQKYSTAKSGNYDLYCLFVERAAQIINKNGNVGFILPHKFFQADFGIGLREFLSKNGAIKEIINFGVNQVFENATTYTCLLFLIKRKNKIIKHIDVSTLDNINDVLGNIISNQKHHDIEVNFIKHPSSSDKWNFSSNKIQNILDKILKNKKTLSDITKKIFQGIPTGADDIFILHIKSVGKEVSTLYSKSLEEDVKIETKLLKPFLLGKDVKRYERLPKDKYILFPYSLIKGNPILLSAKQLEKDFPKAWKYFERNIKILSSREKGRFKKTFWQYSRPQNLNEFFNKKIMMPHLGAKPELTVDNNGKFVHTANIYSYVFKDSLKDSELFFLGLLNSKLLWFFIHNTGTKLRGGYINFKPIYVEPFPVKLIDFSSAKEKSAHDNVVRFVETLLELNEELRKAKRPDEKDRLNNSITHSENRIDEIIYELYGLTKKEISIIGKNLPQ